MDSSGISGCRRGRCTKSVTTNKKRVAVVRISGILSVVPMLNYFINDRWMLTLSAGNAALALGGEDGMDTPMYYAGVNWGTPMLGIGFKFLTDRGTVFRPVPVRCVPSAGREPYAAVFLRKALPLFIPVVSAKMIDFLCRCIFSVGRRIFAGDSAVFLIRGREGDVVVLGNPTDGRMPDSFMLK